jgi:pimeloyl-ACP methyl ester carboxylesterase
VQALEGERYSPPLFRIESPFGQDHHVPLSESEGEGLTRHGHAVAPAASGRRMGATVTEIEGASHVVMISHPKEVAEVVMTAVRSSAMQPV